MTLQTGHGLVCIPQDFSFGDKWDILKLHHFGCDLGEVIKILESLHVRNITFPSF